MPNKKPKFVQNLTIKEKSSINFHFPFVKVWLIKQWEFCMKLKVFRNFELLRSSYLNFIFQRFFIEAPLGKHWIMRKSQFIIETFKLKHCSIKKRLFVFFFNISLLFVQLLPLMFLKMFFNFLWLKKFQILLNFRFIFHHLFLVLFKDRITFRSN